MKKYILKNNFVKLISIFFALLLFVCCSCSFSNVYASEYEYDPTLDYEQIEANFDFEKELYLYNRTYTYTYLDLEEDQLPTDIYSDNVTQIYNDFEHAMLEDSTYSFFYDFNYNVPLEFTLNNDEAAKVYYIPLSLISIYSGGDGPVLYYDESKDINDIVYMGEMSFPFICVKGISSGNTISINNEAFSEPVYIEKIEIYDRVDIAYDDNGNYDYFLCKYETVKYFNKCVEFNNEDYCNYISFERYFYTNNWSFNVLLGFSNGYYNNFIDCLNCRPFNADVTAYERDYPAFETDSVLYETGYDAGYNSLNDLDLSELEFLQNYQNEEDKVNAFVNAYIKNTERFFPSGVNEINYNQIKSGKDSFDSLSASEKLEVDTIIQNNINVDLDYITMYNTAVEFSESIDLQNFIDNYLTDINGDFIVKGTHKNYEQISSGLEVWKSLSTNNKLSVISQITVNNNGYNKSFEDIYDEAKLDYERYNEDVKGEVKGNFLSVLHFIITQPIKAIGIFFEWLWNVISSTAVNLWEAVSSVFTGAKSGVNTFLWVLGCIVLLSVIAGVIVYINERRK